MVKRAVRTLKEGLARLEKNVLLQKVPDRGERICRMHNIDWEHSFLDYKVPMEVYESGSIT